MGLRVKLETALNVIEATAILHNRSINMTIEETDDGFIEDAE